MKATVTVARASVYLSRQICEAHFAGIAAVVPMRREDDLVILPVGHAAAGGCLLKRRNMNGDCVVNVADFLRFHGVDDSAELTLDADWDAFITGLVARGAFVQPPLGVPG
jgi:hypothetical protein